MPCERAEFSVGGVGEHLGGAVGHAALRKKYGGALALGIEFGRWYLEWITADLPLPGPHQTRGVTVKITFFYMEELTGAEPVTLVIADPQATGAVEVHAIRGAKAWGEGRGLAVRGDLQNPAAERGGGVHATRTGAVVFVKLLAGNAVMAEFSSDFWANTGAAGGEVEADVVVAGFVSRGAKGEFMIVAGHAKAITKSLIMIGRTIAIGIPQAREFGALHDHQRVVVFGHDAQRLVQSIGKERPCFGFRFVCVYLTAMETGGQPTVWQNGEPANLRIQPLGRGDVLNLVIIIHRSRLCGAGEQE